MISFIPFFSISLNFECLCICLGLQDKLHLGTVQYSLVRSLINQKLSENKDIELVRSVKFYKFCVLCI